jgi:hypothetical protein
MAFPIIAPSFLREYVDLEKPENNVGKVRYVISPHSVDYVLMLSNPDVTRRFITQTDPKLFTMTYMGEEDEAKFAKNAEALIAHYPLMTYYWPIRQLIMFILEQREHSFARRLLILNHAITTINGMAEQYHQDLIPGFAKNVTATTDFSAILKYFDGVPVNPIFAAADGVSFIKLLFNTAQDIPAAPGEKTNAAHKFKHFYERIYEGLGVSGPETFPMTDFNKYAKKRAEFERKYHEARPNVMENIMINYLWAFAVPFTDPTKTLWDNFTFYIILYNAIKVYLTCIDPKDDDDLVKAIVAFDNALTAASAENKLYNMVLSGLKNKGTDNNGDMAILTLS